MEQMSLRIHRCWIGLDISQPLRLGHCQGILGGAPFRTIGKHQQEFLGPSSVDFLAVGVKAYPKVLLKPVAG